jgi:hypothetical protein
MSNLMLKLVLLLFMSSKTTIGTFSTILCNAASLGLPELEHYSLRFAVLHADMLIENKLIDLLNHVCHT